MATTIKKEEYVDCYVPRGYANDEPNLFVSVNGVNYLLPKGKTSKVPPHIKAAVDRHLKALERQAENSERLIREGQEGIQAK